MTPAWFSPIPAAPRELRTRDAYCRSAPAVAYPGREYAPARCTRLAFEGAYGRQAGGSCRAESQTEAVRTQTGSYVSLCLPTSNNAIDAETAAFRESTFFVGITSASEPDASSGERPNPSEPTARASG